MSMISEQINYLREFDCFGTVKQAMLEAADTIESLSANLMAANMERLETCYNENNTIYSIRKRPK